VSKIVYLEITTWQGISIGATHYYGQLTGRGMESIDLEYTITSAQAARLNKTDEQSWGWKAGDL
jgi:hypothetical protein